MARDMNIGRPTKQNLTRPTEVQNFDSVMDSIDLGTVTVEEAVEELRKIRTGTGLILGQEIEEAE